MTSGERFKTYKSIYAYTRSIQKLSPNGDGAPRLPYESTENCCGEKEVKI
jgi:hypothetical protein